MEENRQPRIIAISDTHGQHRALKLPEEGDILIHAGDLSRKGNRQELEDFIEWFSALNYKYKIFIGGNHDFLLEEAEAAPDNLIPRDLIYLNDSGIRCMGIKLWGSPVTPFFHNWAFNRHRGAAIRKHWNMIPADTDILITHGPPYGILDKTVYGDHTGCEDLLESTMLIKPSFHIFGHIHEAYGARELHGIKYVNASVLNEKYELVNAPVSIGFPPVRTF